MSQVLDLMRRRWVVLRKRYRADLPDEFFENEFYLLTQHPQILFVGVVDDKVMVEFDALHRHEGDCYFLGTFRLTLTPYLLFSGNNKAGFELECIVAGDIEGKKLVAYPLNEEFKFCFGGRADYLRKQCSSCELFAVITTVIESVSHINEDDHHHRRKFRLLQQQGETHDRESTAVSTVPGETGDHDRGGRDREQPDSASRQMRAFIARYMGR